MWLRIGKKCMKVSWKTWSGHHNLQISILLNICGASWSDKLETTIHSAVVSEKARADYNERMAENSSE